MGGTLRRGLWAVPALLVMVAPAAVQGQPDVRNIKPIVMLLVDTSGSMERLPSCTCSTASCTECLPSCSENAASDERNRWATVLEALTGSWGSDFQCRSWDRSSAAFQSNFTYLYDQDYHLPYHEPPLGTEQLDDGVLDAYIDRAKFGLMTFDAEPAFTDLESDLIYESEFTARLSDNITSPGMYSYGEPKAYTFPGCEEPHMIDSGARNQDAPIGRLVSVGSDGIHDFEAINAEVQDTLLQVRPFGGTPIAALLDDFRYYLNNHPDVAPMTSEGGAGDPYAECRPTYAVLLTDGKPAGEMRGSPVNCDSDGYECPYRLSEEIAQDMCAFDSTSESCSGDISGLFVVGFDIGDGETVAQLHDIARLGGTGEALLASDRDTLMQEVARALDRAQSGTTTRTVPAFAPTTDSLQQAQMQFNTGFRIDNEGPWEGVIERRRWECTGDSLEPEEQDIEDEDRFHDQLDEQTGPQIELGACPRGEEPRCLFTVITNDLANLEAHVAGEDPGVAPLSASSSPEPEREPGPPPRDVCDPSGSGGGGGGGGGGGRGPRRNRGEPVEDGLTFEPFGLGNTRIDEDVLDVETDEDRDALIRWVHGMSGSGREDRRLGDIYHSSPIVVGPPTMDVPDEAFNDFRRKPEVEGRPTVLYVGTNDGVFHAIAAKDWCGRDDPHCASGASPEIEAGAELWGFIPPMVLRKLKSARASHQYMVDGTPVVRELFYVREPGDESSGDIYRTVLVVGMRQGARGYFALDVTDPLEPAFMWQFADEEMGYAYGAPGLGQVLVRTTGGGVQERGFVFLPAGTGTDLTEDCGAVEEDDGHFSKPLGCPAQGVGRPPITQGTRTARENIRCWDPRGRRVYVVDVATGERIGELSNGDMSPLTGGVSLFPNEIGQVASRGFVTDHDGRIWRLDMSDPDMGNWSMDQFHDIFYDEVDDATAGQPAYNPPVVSTDNEGRVVLLQASGDIDLLDGMAQNRVVSVTECLTSSDQEEDPCFEADVPEGGFVPSLNWELRLDEGEQVTGPLELFNGGAYFGTFRSTNSPTNACEFGDSWIWGVQYRESAEDGSQQPKPALQGDADDPDSELVSRIGPFENEIVMGVAVTQRPRCVTTDEVPDPYFGMTTYQSSDSGGGGFELVAQMSGPGAASPGGAVSEISQPIAPPLQYTQVQSFAGSVR